MALPEKNASRNNQNDDGGYDDNESGRVHACDLPAADRPRRVVLDEEQRARCGDRLSRARIFTGTPFAVAISHDANGMMTVEVHDHESTPPVLAPFDPQGQRGRGLQLVDTLSREWGVTMIHDDGKTVWFRLSPTEEAL